MNFMVTRTFSPDATNATLERFASTGGMPPDGVKMVSRWHSVASGRGFALAEADDPVAPSKWCHNWNDLLTFEIFPVLDDEQITAVLASGRPA